MPASILARSMARRRTDARRPWPHDGYSAPTGLRPARSPWWATPRRRRRDGRGRGARRRASLRGAAVALAGDVTGLLCRSLRLSSSASSWRLFSSFSPERPRPGPRRAAALRIPLVDGLALEEQVGDLLQLVPVLAPGCGWPCCRPRRSRAGSPASIFCAVSSEYSCAHPVVAAHERLRRVVAEGQRTQVLAHAVLGDHAPRRSRWPVAGRSTRRW